MARPDPTPPDEAALPFTWAELMDMALEQGLRAAALGEAPVGAVLADPVSGEIIARAHNSPISRHDPTAHAEILCLRRAAQIIGNYRLPGTIMAVSLEPCTMCVGALIHARVSGVVVGAPDPRTGALFTHMDGARLPWGNHKMWIVPGILEEQCAQMMRDFFRFRRR
ncbi:MAG: nucleoside deaminase [Desulfovibrionaceae bacterium]